MKMLKKITLITGFEPFTMFNSVWIIASFLLMSGEEEPLLFFAGIGLFILFIVRNCIKLKKIKYIIPITLLQLPYALIVLFIFAYRVSNRFMGFGEESEERRVQKINWAEKSWSGNRAYDDNKARQLGFNNVQDAIEHGIAYDGSEIF